MTKRIIPVQLPDRLSQLQQNEQDAITPGVSCGSQVEDPCLVGRESGDFPTSASQTSAGLS